MNNVGYRKNIKTLMFGPLRLTGMISSGEDSKATLIELPHYIYFLKHNYLRKLSYCYYLLRQSSVAN